tara:strand:+ start:60 stop:284 length:225 start_codon:yes stop_codon:yes gene_type:complete
MAYNMNGPSLYKDSVLKQKTELNTAKDGAKKINKLFGEVNSARNKGDMLTANILNTQAYKIHDNWNNRKKKTKQ